MREGLKMTFTDSTLMYISLSTYSRQYSVIAIYCSYCHKTLIVQDSRVHHLSIMSRLKAIVLLTGCLLIGIVSVLLFSDSTTHRHKLENRSDHSAHSTLKVEMVNVQSALDPFTSIDTDKEHVNARYLYDHLVVVTAFSDNHFEEAKDMIASMQTCLPDKKIIVYDLGLSSNKKKEVQRYCNVELRSFPFENYKQPHIKKVSTYAWKPIIVKLVSQEYDVIMYGDASLRMTSCNMTQALEHLLNFPFLDLHPTSYRAIEFTHDGMMKYLHYPEHRKDIAQLETLQGGCYLMWANSIMQEKLIEPWLDCALHQECIAPKGSRLGPCKFTKHHDGHYVGCHRYDQSALNLILAREFGVDGVLKGSNRNITLPTWKVVRHKTNYYNLSYCIVILDV